jgi:hypothetical protein
MFIPNNSFLEVKKDFPGRIVLYFSRPYKGAERKKRNAFDVSGSERVKGKGKQHYE